MALTSDQKKHLLIGGGVGALALVAGYALLSGRRAHAAALPGGHRQHHGHHRKHAHEDQGQGEETHENERGEYGRKKHKHHHREHGG
jgi:hypothetical protein